VFAGDCTKEEAGRIATAALRKCNRHPGSAAAGVGRGEYFAALEAAGLVNGVHYAYMLKQLEQEEQEEEEEPLPGTTGAAGGGNSTNAQREREREQARQALLAGAGRAARVGADSTAFALLLEHAASVQQLRELWTEMSETGVARDRGTFLVRARHTSSIALLCSLPLYDLSLPSTPSLPHLADRLFG
jgi:hypothetical protein